MKCPKCVGKLQKREISLHTVSEEKGAEGKARSQALEIDQCFVCGGVWFDRGELDKYTTERVTVVDSPSVGGEVDQKMDAKEGKCPRCQTVLQKTPYEKEKSITADVCGTCGGLWLDSTEIDRVEKANQNKVGFLGLFFRGFRKPKEVETRWPGRSSGGFSGPGRR